MFVSQSVTYRNSIKKGEGKLTKNRHRNEQKCTGTETIYSQTLCDHSTTQSQEHMEQKTQLLDFVQYNFPS